MTVRRRQLSSELEIGVINDVLFYRGIALNGLNVCLMRRKTNVE